MSVAWHRGQGLDLMGLREMGDAEEVRAGLVVQAWRHGRGKSAES